MPYGSMLFCQLLRIISEDLESASSRQPTPAPDIGDVGYISKGRFNLLIPTDSPEGLRRFLEPNELEQLEAESPVSVERPAGCLHTPSVQKMGRCHGVSDGFTPLHVLPIAQPSPVTPTLEPSTDFSFNFDGDRGAALVTTGERHRKDYPVRLKPQFEKYIEHNYRSWVQLADGMDARPVLVTGFDVTKDFAVMAYSNKPPPHDPCLDCFPMFESSRFPGRWEWHGEYKPNTHHGPQDARGIPTEFNQRVFIRYHTIRYRTPFEKILASLGGLRSLVLGGNRGEISPKPTVQSGAELPASGDEGIGRQLGPVTEDTGSEPGTTVPNTPPV